MFISKNISKKPNTTPQPMTNGDRLGYNSIIDDYDYRRLARICEHLNCTFPIGLFILDTFLQDLEDGWDRKNLDEDAFDIDEVSEILVKWNMKY